MPLLQVFAVITSILIAAAVIWAVNQSQRGTTTTTPGAIIISAPQQTAVRGTRGPVFRRAGCGQRGRRLSLASLPFYVVSST